MKEFLSPHKVSDCVNIPNFWITKQCLRLHQQKPSLSNNSALWGQILKVKVDLISNNAWRDELQLSVVLSERSVCWRALRSAECCVCSQTNHLFCGVKVRNWGLFTLMTAWCGASTSLTDLEVTFNTSSENSSASAVFLGKKSNNYRVKPNTAVYQGESCRVRSVSKCFHTDVRLLTNEMLLLL